MTRRAFFSFHYKRNVSRAWGVRNSWVTKEDRDIAGFWDASRIEKAKAEGNAAIKWLIDNRLKDTSVTVILIGAKTFGR